jgi:hypothetical protein
MKNKSDNQQDSTTIVTSEQFDAFVDMLRSFGEIFKADEQDAHNA